MNTLKKEIYQFLDQNGFKYRTQMSVSIGFDTQLNAADVTPKTSIKFDTNTFGLSDQEFANVILEYIFDTTNIRINSFSELNQYRSLNGLPFIIPVFEDGSYYPTHTLAFGDIKGTLALSSDDQVASLGNIEKIQGDLNLKGTKLKSLGKLKEIGGSLYIRQLDPPFTYLTSLEKLEKVGHNLILKNSPIKTLNKLVSVGGKLNLRKTPIESLGLLSFVGGDLFLPRRIKDNIDITGINVLGKVKFFAD
jgi:hypothetical protein